MRQKAIISTIHLDYLLSNYGSFWQHWCLRSCLKECGYDVSRYTAYEGEFSVAKWMRARVLDFARIYLVNALKLDKRTRQ